jgi:hypothetical protein
VGSFFLTTTTTTKRRKTSTKKNKKRFIEMLLKRDEGLGLADWLAGWPELNSDHVLASSCPCIAITKREREKEKRKIEAQDNVCELSGEGKKENIGGSGIRNTAEDAPIEIERDEGGGFLFLQRRRKRPTPPNSENQIDCVCVW